MKKKSFFLTDMKKSNYICAAILQFLSFSNSYKQHFSPSNTMEELMYYVWQQRLFNSISTLDGQPIEIIHPGLRNLDAGPDFFNAKIKMDGLLFIGNVEMHSRASDWYRHHHHEDKAYDSVILHVVMQADAVITLHDGTPVKTVVMHIPEDVMARHHELLADRDPFCQIRCAPRLGELPKLYLHDWLTALCTKRMIEKTQRYKDLVDNQLYGWREAFYVALTRSLGTGVNSDAMERLARSLPYSCILHHKDNLLQIEALLLGQANLLNLAPENYAGMTEAGNLTMAQIAERQRLLQREYAFLKQKFSLEPLPVSVWMYGRVRPQAQPHVRLKALAVLLWTHQDLFTEILEAENLETITRILSVKGIGSQTVRSLIINAVIPILIGYAQWQGDDEKCESTLEMLEQIPAEDNRYIQLWVERGIPVRSAFDSQALLHLYRNYCEHHLCMHCRWGCWFVKNASLPYTIGKN